MYSYFVLKMMSYWKNIILFGIKSPLIIKNVDIERACNLKNWKNKAKSYGDEAKKYLKKAPIIIV